MTGTVNEMAVAMQSLDSISQSIGRQVTDNYRQTGFFPADTCASTGSTAFCVPLADPAYDGTVDFRNNLTSDADNHGVATVAANAGAAARSSVN